MYNKRVQSVQKSSGVDVIIRFRTTFVVDETDHAERVTCHARRPSRRRQRLKRALPSEVGIKHFVRFVGSREAASFPLNSENRNGKRTTATFRHFFGHRGKDVASSAISELHHTGSLKHVHYTMLFLSREDICIC